MVLGAFLAALDGRNSSWAVKIEFCKKWGVHQELEFRGHFYPIFFSQHLKFDGESTPQDASIAPKMASYGQKLVK